jgi:hypothetical protein
LDKAEEKYRQALSIREHVLRSVHPAIAQRYLTPVCGLKNSSYHALGYVKTTQAKYDEAESFYRRFFEFEFIADAEARSLSIVESLFGPEHPGKLS